MQISVYAVGRKMPAWVNQASADYIKRMPRRWQFEVREFAQSQGDSSDVIMAREADMLLAAIPDKAHVIALDNRGAAWSTEQVAGQLERWQELGKSLVVLIGGADGLHPRCRERADQMWSLSPLTFPHPLVRVVLAEQLYRAQTLLDNHPYHRA
ncbi:23S rRNA (pseudouridine(1915)-N(3))-methyltransferase RlmH [Granulosicoccus antarcticus]|uniref:Ribosomal RNA large subunit methyltransferase H n=1 Tax=Granulosicoccus antarcticus IMCC3135 TaxID=1192854 RepID=A0A2Z2P5Z5_9GAMM|nr:23S rRNA (pseudouridine(1915)-N(3))-methyltransferase RlmH [Granulosicoccus antarcticus]ASJ76127.1 Ribosomal RNA large subunit methyltransferase H [Granulosicoccus antarcticus IMCC3135]